MINNENISLFELASQFPDLTISVKCSDLFDAFRSVIHEEELKRENLLQDKNEEVLLTEKEVTIDGKIYIQPYGALIIRKDNSI